jgi:hypothetical protein
MDQEKILKRFTNKALDRASRSSALTNKDWIHIERLVRAAVTDTGAEESKQLSQLVHHLYVQNKLLYHENYGLKTALTAYKKHKKKGSILNL